MRGDVHIKLTAGRVRSGDYASTDAYGLTGAFFVTCPETGRQLRLISSRGEDWGESGLPGCPWEHVSVSLRSPDKTPCWAEMEWVRSLFWRDDELVVQFSPPRAEKVNLHNGCLHLWRPTDGHIRLPPTICV